MTELKTLKDLDKYYKELKVVGISNIETFSNELRQEAIKWIKFLKEKSQGESYDKCESIPLDDIGNLSLECGVDGNTGGAIIILQHFFNISEEDLL